MIVAPNSPSARAHVITPPATSVGNDSGAGGARREVEAEVRAHQLADRPVATECSRDLVTVAAEVERQREGPADIVEPLDQALGDLALQERALRPAACRAIAPVAQDGAVEDEQGVRQSHGLYVGRKAPQE